MHKLIVPLGIVTLVFLVATFATGIMLFKFHVKWVKIKLHIRLGALTLILAIIHAAIVIFVNR